MVFMFVIFFFLFSQASIREGAVAALRAALAVTSQRETKASQRSVYKVDIFFSYELRING